jgi:succinate-semialdehyde dehydrogenase/glutarate-semialdehyde dehydrogenase
MSAEPELVRPLAAAASGRAARLFIDGSWHAGAAGRDVNVDPATGDVIGTVELADANNVNDALEAASRAFAAWRNEVAAERGAILRNAAANLAARLEATAEALLLETGKTRREAEAEIQRAVETFRWNGEEAGRVEGHLLPGAFAGSSRSLVPVPLGVVVAITAWNFPAVLTARKLGAALAAGCTVVLKAAEGSPLTPTLLVQALVDAGLPPGTVNLVFGDPPQVTRQLLSSPLTRAVTFTGSTQVGRAIAELAAPRLIRSVLELGGHAPVIVCDDADLDTVINATSPAKFGSAGQSCVAPSRYLVHRSKYEELVSRLAEHARSLRLGHGSDPDVTMGPVANQRRLDALVLLTEDAVRRGARLVCGGRQLNRPGYFFEPTVIADVPAEAEIMRLEPFGPIAAVVAWDDFEQALEQANATDFAFAAYLFTDSLSRRMRAVHALRATNIGINQMAPSLPDAPLGGLGDSGYGYEGGREGVLSFVQFRLVSETAPLN